MKKMLAAGAIAGAAVGFSALATAQMAFADNTGNSGCWRGSGNANDNNTIFGQMGSGNSNQFGNVNGNIMNNQLNALSPSRFTGTRNRRPLLIIDFVMHL